MRVLHINSYYSYSLFYKKLYDKQKESGLDINVYVPVPDTFNKNLNLGEYTTISKNHGKYDRIIFQIKHRKIYDDIIKTYDISKFSLVHAHSLFSNGYIACKIKEKYNVPYIVAVRNTDVNVFFKYMPHLRKLGIEILKKADRVIFLSKTYRDYLVDKYIPSNLKKEIFIKSKLIPNGIDDFWLKNKGIPRILTNKNEINMLTVGIVNKNKNQLMTVKAIKLLLKKGYKVKYTVVGKIKDKKVYRQIKDLSYVQYISHTSKEELLDIYRKNDIFVMPSITETFGLVYAEAMSQGLPVIYTRGQGFDGQFEEWEVGCSVDARCAEEIASKIIIVSKNYNNISERCIKFVDNFNWCKISNKYEQIYESILEHW